MSRNQFNILWLQSGGCGGCSMSLLCAESPDVIASLASAGINLLWHPALSEQTGSEVIELLEQICAGEIHLHALCIEGSLLRGPNGTGRFHMLSGTDQAMTTWVRRLAAQADYSVAVGSCAAFGGITSAGSNPADACGMQYEGTKRGGLLGEDFISPAGLPVINIAGCPTHPGWVTESLMLLALNEFTQDDLDEYARPLLYTEHLVHHGCSRNEFYEYKASAEKSSDLGCMMENMGCVGTQAHADCNLRSWNGQGSCITGGYACINCTAPEFEEPGYTFTRTQKLAGIPIGLPTDMPKAWFVALSSLSKAATPKRLRDNAVSDHVVSPPTVLQKKKL